MNQQDRDHIRRNYMELLDSLKSSIENVCIFLMSSKIITEHMKEDILEGKNTNRKRAMALLDLLPTRGPHAYEFLYAAALKSELFTVADILRPDRKPHQVLDGPNLLEDTSEFNSTEEPLPDRWPSEEALTDIDKKIRKITEEDKMLCKLYQKHLVAGQETTYFMTHRERGKVVMINNEKFENLDVRNGSDKDKKSLQQLFLAFGFDVVNRNDLTNAEMLAFLKKEANRIKEDHDCFILVILSHGAEGVVFGTDGCRGTNGPENCTKIKDIRNLFCQVPALLGKPKLFFIQACQGVLQDSGQTPGGTKNSSEKQQQDTGSSKNQDATGDAVDAVGETIGSQADVFVAMSTVADYISWRHTVYGTWFIQAIVYIFAHYGYKYDLNSLMTLVKRLVGKAETSQRFKQVCESTSTMQKTFYFFPGLHMDQNA